MKKHNILYGIIFLGLILSSIKTTAQISKAEIKATGLTCSMCSNAINKQLKSMAEVVDVETDLNTNTFTVVLKEDNTLTPKIFKEKVEKAGFFIGSLILTTKLET
ncbi:MAG TPA: heavy-metal-associated domain-containing protein, partial [Saprospiraceae bacterium]|nr:heavy-metal-associated domain-containing protein [Saprospiraceae bacterium]